MYNTLYYHCITTKNNRNVLRMFFEDWADRICDNKVTYSVASDCFGIYSKNDIIRVEFANEEDATMMKLKGVPEEFQSHIKLIHACYTS